MLAGRLEINQSTKRTILLAGRLIYWSATHEIVWRNYWRKIAAEGKIYQALSIILSA